MKLDCVIVAVAVAHRRFLPKRSVIVKAARELSPALVPSLADYGSQRLQRLCEALALPASERSAANALFQLVSSSWPAPLLAATPPWENDLTDDGTPFEFSVGFEREKPELRLL